MTKTSGLALALLLSGPAWAAPRQAPQTKVAKSDPRAQVLALLSGYEQVNPSEALRRIPQAADLLVAIAQDPAVSGLRRVRAIEALGHVPTAAGLSYLRAVVARTRGRGDGLSIYELSAATRALGGFGAPVTAELLPLLGHESPDVREGAAHALGKIGTPEAKAALRDRIVVEKDSGVRATLAAEASK